jgi:hypothetical protein
VSPVISVSRGGSTVVYQANLLVSSTVVGHRIGLERSGKRERISQSSHRRGIGVRTSALPLVKPRDPPPWVARESMCNDPSFARVEATTRMNDTGTVYLSRWLAECGVAVSCVTAYSLVCKAKVRVRGQP